jgi:hypothetical protein
VQISASGGSQAADHAAWRAQMVKTALKGLDTDGDGKISQAEFQAAMQKLPANPASAAANGTAQAAIPAANPGGTQADAIGNAFKALDSNGDGSVSQSELASALAAGSRHHHHPLLAAASAGATSGAQPGSVQGGLASVFAAQLMGQGQAVSDAGQATGSGATAASTAAQGSTGFDLLGLLQEQFLNGDPTTALATTSATATASSQDAGNQAAGSLTATEQARQMLMRYAFTQIAAPPPAGTGILA